MTDPRKLTQPDYCSRSGAEALAAKAQRFWHDQGYREVRFWVDASRCEDSTHKSVVAVRCNLVNGLPPRPAPLSRTVGRESRV
jgi:hypothetical protein